MSLHTPQAWEKARIRFKARVNPKATVDLDPSAQVSFVPMEAVGDDGSLALDRTRLVSEVSQGYTYFEDGDVSIAKITPCFENGKGAVMEGLVGGVGFGTTELIVLRPEDEISPRFLYYVTQSDHFRGPGEAAMLGSGGQKRVPDLFVKDFEAAWPNLVQQIAIASYLDAETARIDRLIEEKNRLLATLKEMRRSTVAEAVTRGVRGDRAMRPSGLSWVQEIPADWQTLSLKRFVRLSGGHTPTTGNPAFWDGAVPWFSPKDMKADELHDSIDHVTDLAVQDSGLQVIAPGTTMIVVRGMILAHTFPVCVSQVNATINQDMKALVPVDVVDPRFLPWLLRGASALFLSLTEQSAHGTMALRTDRFMSEQLPIPPLAEQIEIVERLEAERARIDALLSQIDLEVELLQELRSATITDAVLGRIDVRAHMKD